MDAAVDDHAQRRAAGGAAAQIAERMDRNGGADSLQPVDRLLVDRRQVGVRTSADWRARVGLITQAQMVFPPRGQRWRGQHFLGAGAFMQPNRTTDYRRKLYKHT